MEVNSCEKDAINKHNKIKDGAETRQEERERRGEDRERRQERDSRRRTASDWGRGHFAGAVIGCVSALSVRTPAVHEDHKRAMRKKGNRRERVQRGYLQQEEEYRKHAKQIKNVVQSGGGALESGGGSGEE